MKTITSAALALVLLAGCRTADSEKHDRETKRSGAAAALAGEWVASGDEYLLFKPEEMDPRTGRFGGFGSYDRYEVGRLAFGRRLPVELTAAADGTVAPRKVTVELGAGGTTLVMTAPPEAPGGRPLVRTYRKAAQ